jgi:hypothetical protein
VGGREQTKYGRDQTKYDGQTARESHSRVRKKDLPFRTPRIHVGSTSTWNLVEGVPFRAYNL